jgi:hypothetical protein
MGPSRGIPLPSLRSSVRRSPLALRSRSLRNLTPRSLTTPFLSDPFAVEGFREDSLEEGAAAPVPTFLGEEPLAQHAPSPKPRSSGRREKRSPAPISRAMEPWLVWLPGVFRSRPRP